MKKILLLIPLLLLLTACKEKSSDYWDQLGQIENNKTYTKKIERTLEDLPDYLIEEFSELNEMIDTYKTLKAFVEEEDSNYTRHIEQTESSAFNPSDFKSFRYDYQLKDGSYIGYCQDFGGSFVLSHVTFIQAYLNELTLNPPEMSWYYGNFYEHSSEIVDMVVGNKIEQWQKLSVHTVYGSLEEAEIVFNERLETKREKAEELRKEIDKADLKKEKTLDEIYALIIEKSGGVLDASLDQEDLSVEETEEVAEETEETKENNDLFNPASMYLDIVSDDLLLEWGAGEFSPGFQGDNFVSYLDDIDERIYYYVYGLFGHELPADGLISDYTDYDHKFVDQVDLYRSMFEVDYIDINEIIHYNTYTKDNAYYTFIEVQTKASQSPDLYMVLETVKTKFSFDVRRFDLLSFSSDSEKEAFKKSVQKKRVLKLANPVTASGYLDIIDSVDMNDPKSLNINGLKLYNEGAYYYAASLFKKGAELQGYSSDTNNIAMSSYNLACVLSILKDQNYKTFLREDSLDISDQDILDYLELSFELREDRVERSKVDPDLAAIRNNPSYIKLINRH